jgi:hypothetical protein
MTTRIWVGGGTNNIYASADWSPAGRPQAGDTLWLYSGTADMAGGNLSGDTLNVGSQTSYSTPGAVTVNLSNGATLSAIASTAAFVQQSIVFNASGYDTLHLAVDANYYATMNTTVNIAAASHLSGTVAVSGHDGALTINAPAGSTFNNSGSSTIGTNDGATINAAVAGNGSFSVAQEAALNFLQPVGSGQSVTLSGSDTLTIGTPHNFAGLVNIAPSASSFSVELAGITGVDSYSYQNDMLTLFSSNQKADTLRFADSEAFQVAENGSGVFIGAAGAPPPTGGIILPLHSGT